MAQLSGAILVLCLVACALSFEIGLPKGPSFGLRKSFAQSSDTQGSGPPSGTPPSGLPPGCVSGEPCTPPSGTPPGCVDGEPCTPPSGGPPSSSSS